jgi:hypothetical protein
MATELPHGRGKIAIQGVGFATEVESFSSRYTGDPEQLVSTDGVVGVLPAKSKGAEISFTVFIPNVDHVYSAVQDYWKDDTRVTLICWYGNSKCVCKGRFNGPEVSDDGTKMSCTFIGADPKISTA